MRSLGTCVSWIWCLISIRWGLSEGGGRGGYRDVVAEEVGYGRGETC